MAKHRNGYLYKVKNRKTYKAGARIRGAVYYLQYRIGGKLHNRSLRTTDRQQAEKERARILDGIRTGNETEAIRKRIAVLQAELAPREHELAEMAKEKALTVADAWQAFIGAGNRGDIADSTLTIYGYYWRRFMGWLDEHHPKAKKLRDVTFEIAEAYKTHMTRERKVTGKTFNEHRAFLRTFFNVLSDKAKLDSNPWAKITRRRHKSKGRDPLTTEELVTVCSSADGELRIMLALGLYLGARMGDACTLSWGNVDLKHKERIGGRVVTVPQIVYTPRKTANAESSEPLTIPIHPELHRILSETPASKRKGRLTPKLARLYLEKGPYAVSRQTEKIRGGRDRHEARCQRGQNRSRLVFSH